MKLSVCNGRVIDPASNLDRTIDLHLADGRVIAIGDAPDGYPGILGIGAVTAARMLNEYGPIEAFPEHVLGDRRKQALLFKKIATLETGTELFRNVDALRWRGPTAAFAAWADRFAAPRLLERCLKVQQSMQE